MSRQTPLTPGSIHAARWLIVLLLRAAGLLLMSVGLYLAIKKIAFAMGSGTGMEMLEVWTGVGEEHSLYRGVAMFAVGLILALLSRPLARWIVRVPDDGCPRCLYARPEGGADRCPECGYRYPDAEGAGA